MTPLKFSSWIIKAISLSALGIILLFGYQNCSNTKLNADESEMDYSVDVNTDESQIEIDHSELRAINSTKSAKYCYIYETNNMGKKVVAQKGYQYLKDPKDPSLGYTNCVMRWCKKNFTPKGGTCISKDARSDYDAQVFYYKYPSVINLGESGAVKIGVKNIGKKSWVPSEVRLKFLKPTSGLGEGCDFNLFAKNKELIKLSKTVKPGEVYYFSFNVKAPHDMNLVKEYNQICGINDTNPTFVDMDFGMAKVSDPTDEEDEGIFFSTLTEEIYGSSHTNLIKNSLDTPPQSIIPSQMRIEERLDSTEVGVGETSIRPSCVDLSPEISPQNPSYVCFNGNAFYSFAPKHTQKLADSDIVYYAYDIDIKYMINQKYKKFTALLSFSKLFSVFNPKTQVWGPIKWTVFENEVGSEWSFYATGVKASHQKYLYTALSNDNFAITPPIMPPESTCKTKNTQGQCIVWRACTDADKCDYEQKLKNYINSLN